jgi:hypothetical protein
VQPDYSLNALDLAYVLPDDAGGSWYVGLSHNGSTTCDFNLTAWVERTLPIVNQPRFFLLSIPASRSD